MADYKEMYLRLFNSISDALKQIERQNYGEASDLLKQAQRETEEQYINAKDEG
ncbi:MAG: hypothetical protein GX025_07525 [Clostridiales bacterium]|nr:hypothetical protein [Clostridiales bacterium]